MAQRRALPDINRHTDIVAGAVIILSVIPIVVEVVRERRRRPV